MKPYLFATIGLHKIMKTISVVIPVYNEEKYITTVIDNVLKSDTCGLKKEIIVVDDCSKDKTFEKLSAFVKTTAGRGKNIKIFSLDKNMGKGWAVKQGLIKTTGDLVIIQDADFEYSPDDYPILIEPFLKNDADAVFGSRFISNRPHRVMYFWHYMANIFLTILSNMFTNLNLTDMETGYKAFKGDIIRNIAKKLESRRFGFEPEVTARISKIKSIKVFEVGISYSGRTYEEGKKINWTDGVKAIYEIFKYNLFS